MKYIMSYGAVYKLTNKSYKQLMKDIASGEGYDLRKVGAKQITDGYCIDITDMEADEAEEKLDELKTEKTEK